MGPRKRLPARKSVLLVFSHLVLFLGHTTLWNVVEAGEKDQRDLWRWCSTSPSESLIEDFEIRLDPYPIQTGRNLTLHLKGNLKQELTDLRLKTVITVNRFLRVSYTRNLCSEQTGLCPLKPGRQEVKVSYLIPSVLVGPINVDAVNKASPLSSSLPHYSTAVVCAHVATVAWFVTVALFVNFFFTFR